MSWIASLAGQAPGASWHRLDLRSSIFTCTSARTITNLKAYNSR